MKKFISFIMAIVLMLTAVPLCTYAADEATVEQVEEMLTNIDTLQQMQNKRSQYSASGHYDITTTDANRIAKHKAAREGYDSYVAEMFAKRAAAQQAFDALSDEQKAQIDSSLVAKLNNELPTVFKTGEYAVSPRNDEYSFEAVRVGLGFAYEVSNHMVSGSIPQTFVLVDTSDGATTWSPSGEYVYDESNYIVAYCCDKETGLEYETDYKRINLEDSDYFDADAAQHIRAVLANSYPFVSMDEMKANLKKGGLNAGFVDSLTRADLIAAVQMTVWSYANINDAAANGLEYFASIDVPKNTGIYFTPLHDYTNEVWDWLPGKRQRSFDEKAEYRVNTLAQYLCNLQPVEPTKEQTVISEVEVVRTELLSEENGIYDVTVYVTLNGGGDERDNLNITATAYSENEDGTLDITAQATQKAKCENNCYCIDISVKDGNKLKIEIDGEQYIAKGAYFYSPEGGRNVSQSLVSVSEGNTAVRAESEIIFSAPEYTIEAPASFTVKHGEKTKLDVKVIPEIGAPDITFSSSNESIVTVDADGYVTAVATGKATIKAELPNGNFVIIPVTVKPSSAKKHYVVFGKTEKIGWYSVSMDGGKTFQTVFGNSNLVLEEGTVLTIKAVDVFGDPFTFYINGDAVKPDENGYVTVKVEDYMLIGALGIPVTAPDAEESLNFFEKLIKAIEDFFKWIASWFE